MTAFVNDIQIANLDGRTTARRFLYRAVRRIGRNDAERLGLHQRHGRQRTLTWIVEIAAPGQEIELPFFVVDSLDNQGRRNILPDGVSQERFRLAGGQQDVIVLPAEDLVTGENNGH